MKPLHVIVCIKPIPDPSRWDKLKLDPETMILCREEIAAVINPLDRNALEEAFLLRERFGGEVSALSMAPPGAEEQLQEALAMGCDRAYLLTDPAFAAADTLATARCLRAAIAKIGDYDLILCGGYSLDGSTAQVGPQIAELLGIPDLTQAFRIEPCEDELRVSCRLEHGHAVYDVDLPVLITLDKDANQPRPASMLGLRRALGRGPAVWNAADLCLDPETVGLAGSPTRMLSIHTPAVGRKGEMLQGSPNEMAADLIVKLRRDHVIP
jgi:electron transfer flavoprotein beta subunit